MPATPDDFDIVQVIKQEWSDLGGGEGSNFPSPNAPLSPFQDAPEVPCLYIVEDGRRNKAVAVWAYQGQMRFRDVSNPGAGGAGYTLGDLIAGTGGLTTEAHKALRQLIHFIDDGPAEGFASGAYKETLPAGSPFPTSEIWYTNSGKTQKIVELTTTWTGVNITSEEWKMYAADGTTVLVTATDAISYSGVFETSRTRTIVVP